MCYLLFREKKDYDEGQAGIASCLFGVGSFGVICSSESTPSIHHIYKVTQCMVFLNTLSTINLISSLFLFSFTSPFLIRHFVFMFCFSSCRRLINFPPYFRFHSVIYPPLRMPSSQEQMLLFLSFSLILI